MKDSCQLENTGKENLLFSAFRNLFFYQLQSNLLYMNKLRFVTTKFVN